MTTPNQPKPDGAYVWDSDSDYGTTIPADEDNIMAMMRKNTASGYLDAQGGFGSWLANALANLLGQIVGMIAAGVQAAAGVVVGVITTIVEGVTAIFNSIGAALGFGGPESDNPINPENFEDGSVLADIRDGQRALVNKIALLEDNAGFCTLTPSRDLSVVGYVFKWVPVRFDTKVTASKNAEPVDFYISTNVDNNLASTRWTYGIELLAPGVWTIDAMVAIASGDTRYRYYEMDMRVFKCFTATVSGKNGPYASETYTNSRVMDHTDAAYNDTAVGSKSVLIPDDGYRYVVAIFVRFNVEYDWNILGGTVWSQLSVNRLSTDTRDYNAPANGVGTVTETGGGSNDGGD